MQAPGSPEERLILHSHHPAAHLQRGGRCEESAGRIGEVYCEQDGQRADAEERYLLHRFCTGF